MSLITQAMIAEKYGVRLSMDKLAEALGIARGTIYNQIIKGTFPVVTYLDHSGSRWCDYRALAEYLDECWAKAKAATEAPPPPATHNQRSKRLRRQQQ